MRRAARLYIRSRHHSERGKHHHYADHRHHVPQPHRGHLEPGGTRIGDAERRQPADDQPADMRRIADARHHQTEDGEIWYTGSKGVNAFYPDQIKENDFIPPVYLTSLKQGGEDLIVDKALEKLDEITLDWKNNFFEMILN